jgi:hypothetical protein
MRRLTIPLAMLTVIAGCSGDRERGAAAAPDSAKQAVAMVPMDSVLPAEEQAPISKAKQSASRTHPSKRLHRPKTKRPTTPTDTMPAASAAGYAPSPDTLPEPVPDRAHDADGADTTVRQRTDTALVPTVDTVSAATPGPTPDRVADSGIDSTERRDTVAPTPAPVTPTSPAGSNTLPAGTEMRAVLDDSINSRNDSAGRALLARIAGDVAGPGGEVLVPAGSEVQLTIVRLEPAKSRSASDGKLSLRVDAITIDGRPVPVHATVQPVSHELRGRGVTAGEVEKVGVGTAAGAVAGRVITGKTKGAVIGGVVGAAGGAVVAAQTASRDVVVRSGTTVAFTLTAPLMAATAP